MTSEFTQTWTNNGWRFNHYDKSYASADHMWGTDCVVHLHNVSVFPDYRGKGLGSQYHRERLEFLLTQEKVTLLTCIVNSNNTAQLKILEKNKWEQIYTFRGDDDAVLILCVRRNVDMTPRYDPQQSGDKDDDI